MFVIVVDDAGPAAKAGIEEGSRIASINGVDVRGRAPATKTTTAFRNVERVAFEREVSKLKPGDDVDAARLLQRSVQERQVKAVRAGRSAAPQPLDDDHRRRQRVSSVGDANPGRRGIEINGEQIGDKVRRALEGARIATNAAVGGALGGFGRGLMFGNRVVLVNERSSASATIRRGRRGASELDLRSQLDDAVRRNAEELRRRARVARHDDEELLAPARHRAAARASSGARRVSALRLAVGDDDALAAEIERRVVAAWP